MTSREYTIPTWRIAGHVRDGERLDLGGRIVEVVRTPGHTPDSLCLLDCLEPYLKLLFPAHGSPVAEPRRLLELQKALQDIQAETARFEPTAEGQRLFRFEHFSILMDRPD